MTPFYFGSSHEPLFGVYHAPNCSTATKLGIVVCYPVGHEYFRVHRMLCQAAIQWSQVGIHVLRFDYFATGDSSGIFSAANNARWREDVNNAISELKAVSGVRKVCLVGCRLGANIALDVSASNKWVNSIVCWDPVISTGQYLQDLVKLNHRMLLDPDRFLTERIASNELEILGFEYSQTLRSDLERDNSVTEGSGEKAVSLCLSADFNDDFSRFLDRHQYDAAQCSTIRLSNSANWGEVSEIETAIKSPDFADIVTGTIILK